MRFTIITTQPGDQPPKSPYDFLPPGGTIGRGDDCHLMLPDSSRTISRLQATVNTTAEGKCYLTNRGNVAGILLNDIPLAQGIRVVLQDGDILSIGGYKIRVNNFGSVPQSQNTSVSSTSVVSPEVIQDKPVVEEATAAIPSEIWDSLIKEFSIADDLSKTPHQVEETEEVHPLTEPDVVERNPENPLQQWENNTSLDIGQQPEQSSLFDDGDALFAEESIFEDRTPSTLSVQKQTESTSGELDPLNLFGSEHSTETTNPDDPLGLIEGSAALSSSSLFDHTETQPIAEPQPDVQDNEPEPVAADLPQEGYKGITLPEPQAVPHTQMKVPKGRLRIDPVAVASHTPKNMPGSDDAVQHNGNALKGELLDALLEGMGLNDVQPTPQFSVEQMRQLGQMISMFSQGTVALLSSRSILKRGVKADMTMILDDANNPFKLLPSGKTVLMQMFGSQMPGFMPPRQAVRDALIDLQAHQLGMIAGIRAIIASMLQSFNPEQLEENARKTGTVSRLGLPGSRKAALWEYFVEHYGKTAGEIGDDFHTLFGEAFLYAYDLEVNQYKDSQTHTDDA